MKRLRFCMVPIAAMLFVLLAMSFAWAKVVDFRANITPTVVKTGENAYLVVELLNDQGQVDPFGYQEVVKLQVQVASLLSDNLKIGSSNNGTHTVDANDKGVVLATIDYEDVQPGTDTISVTLKERIVNPDTGNEYWRVIKSQTFNVTIQQAQNTAKSVEVTDISLPQDPVEDEAGNYPNQKCDSVTSGCTVEAGNSFIINLKACDGEPYIGSCNKVSTQNSNVYVYLVGTGVTNKVEGNYATSSDVYEFNGTFENGVASITVPEGTVTKAGKYKIYITTDGKKNFVTGENKAIEHNDYYVVVSPRQAAKVKVEVYSRTADQTGKAWCWVNSDGINENQSSKVVAKLLDQYDNVADEETGIGDSDKVTVKIKYNNNDVAELNLEKNSVTNSTYLNCSEVDNFGSLDEGDRVEKSFTVTLDKNDLGVEQVNTSLSVNVYADYIALNGAAFDDDNFLATASGLMNNGTISNIILSAGNSTTDSNGTWVLNSFGYDDNITPLKLTFFGTNEQTVEVNSTTNGIIESGDLEIDNLAAGASNNSTCAWLEDDNNEKYLPKTCTEIDAAPLVAMAKAKDIKIYQIKSYRYFPNGTSQVDFAEVTGDINLSGSSNIVLTLRDFNATADDDNVTILYGVKYLHDNNATVKAAGDDNNATEKFPEYTARVVDSSGNFADSTDLRVSCLHGDNSTGSVDISGNKIYVKWSDTTVTEDTCTFKAGSLTKQVTVHLSWSAGPDHVNIDAPSDYVLTTSKAPLVISLRNADDTEYGDDPGNYTIRISDPSLVRVYNSTDMNTEIEDGEDIDWNSDGKATIFVQTLATTGDVTITVKNSAGTVTGTKTLNIVEKESDIPVIVGSVTTSPASLSLMQQEEGTITATVKDTGGNPVSGIEVSAESDNTDIATVSPATCTTDANGQCTFTITAGTTEGTAHITLTAQGQSAVVDVEVTQEQAQCDADHLNLCTTEEDCTAAGGYWYDNACHETPQEQPEQPQPVPTEPTTQEISDVSTAPVNLGAVAAGTGDTMEMALNFPPYENPVDMYVGILLPTGHLFVLQSDNTFTLDLVPYAQNVTDAVSATVFEPFEVCQTTPFGTTALIPEGTYYVFSLVVPTGTDLAGMDSYDLRYYSFNVSCGD